MRAVSKKKARENRAKGPIRDAVFERDAYRCVLAGIGGAGRCWGPLTPHHTRKQSQGGAYTLACLVTMCASHNDRVESDANLAAIAEAHGYVKRHGTCAFPRCPVSSAPEELCTAHTAWAVENPSKAARLGLSTSPQNGDVA